MIGIGLHLTVHAIALVRNRQFLEICVIVSSVLLVHHTVVDLVVESNDGQTRAIGSALLYGHVIGYRIRHLGLRRNINKRQNI